MMQAVQEVDQGPQTEHAAHGSDNPARAAFLTIATADFHPPDWYASLHILYNFNAEKEASSKILMRILFVADNRAVEPDEANAHARLEVFRDSKQCATYIVAAKKVNIFGRDQENCDHILGNPSISRKHAAMIHDAEGGIYVSIFVFYRGKMLAYATFHLSVAVSKLTIVKINRLWI